MQIFFYFFFLSAKLEMINFIKQKVKLYKTQIKLYY